MDHYWFRELLDSGWVDAADARGMGLRSTFGGPGAGAPVPPVTLDHVLVDTDVLVEHVSTRPLPGSDHLMLIVRLRLPAG
jgi:endonuclease/exonuclease/phosphatase family metal-dependent hydrolase